MMNRVDKIKELISTLNKASDAYYNSDNSIMSDYEWDNLYDELVKLEREIGIVYPNSPTINVGHQVLDELEEVEHNHPMLSLDKTKSSDELVKFAGDNECVLSVKCDGLTCSLEYENGKLIKAESRGNGVVGVNVLSNALTIKNIPHTIPYKENLIIDGEVIIDWKTFNEINSSLPDDKKYKHPRNLVSGSLQLLDSSEAAKRNMRFVAWRVIKGFGHVSMFTDLKEAERNGFEVVPMFTYVNSADSVHIDGILESIQIKADNAGIPYDGAVMAIDNYKLAESMGRTDKFYRHSIAYKYEDSLYETILEDIEWNTSRTGQINPVAIFQPVDLDGAITTRATLHNVTYIKNMRLGIGDRIRIYRSNKVIPKMHDSIDKSGNVVIPTKCPCCGEPTIIIKDKDSEILKCTNPDCLGRLSGKLVNAASRNALDIDGLSEATIEKFIDLGWLTSLQDIYHLRNHEKEMYKLEGFGKKSVTKLLDSIDKSRNTTFDKFLYAQSIPLIGKGNSKDISKICGDNINEFKSIVDLYDMPFINMDGFGVEKSVSIKHWWELHHEEFNKLAKEFTFIKKEAVSNNSNLDGMTFVITGSLNCFVNRDALKEKIESCGGKVSTSVSSKTTALINNDVESKSSKNQKAIKLGIPIITEENFIERYDVNE